MEIVNQLPRTQRGNRYILTVVDHFTRHVEAYALPDQVVATIARVLLNKLISHFCFLYIIHTDQEANLESHMVKELF